MRQAKADKKNETNSRHPPEKPTQGPVDGVLHGLGEIVPGFADLVKGLESSEVFRQRLAAANTESERLMGKAPPLTGTGGTRRSIIPPGINLKVSRATSAKESPAAPRRDVMIEMFDERENLTIIVELPGIIEKDIEINVKGSRLGLFARSENRRYQKIIALPCLVKEKTSFTYKNGILKINLVKDLKKV